MQFYSDPSREQDPHTLPDCEVFHVDAVPACCQENQRYGRPACCDPSEPGFYWRLNLPHCLQDGHPNGPFDTEALAIADARESAGVE